MIMKLRYFTQDEYTLILDEHNARLKKLTQSQCERILMDRGCTYEQAKNGAYVYLHHGNHTTMYQRGSQDIYDQILDDFRATNKKSMVCIRHLEGLGYSYGQSKTAVYKYRLKRGLIRKDR